MTKIVVIDYGFGNHFSIKQAFKTLDYEINTTSNPNEILDATNIILPGVGAFKRAMQELKRLNLDTSINKAAKEGIPILGICLGMQLLFQTSEEFGLSNGLGLISGNVKILPSKTKDGKILKKPNIGWNKIYKNKKGNSNLNLLNNTSYYFIHSYGVKVEKINNVVSHVDFGGHAIPAIVKEKNICGFQFHPEKSGENGLKLLDLYIKQKI